MKLSFREIADTLERMQGSSLDPLKSFHSMVKGKVKAEDYLPAEIDLNPYLELLSTYNVSQTHSRQLAALSVFAKIFYDHSSQASFKLVESLRNDLKTLKELEDWRTSHYQSEGNKLHIIYGGKQFTFNHADVNLIIDTMKKQDAEQSVMIDVVMKGVRVSPISNQIINKSAPRPEIAQLQIVVGLINEYFEEHDILIKESESLKYQLVFDLLKAAGLFSDSKYDHYSAKEKYYLIRSYLHNFHQKVIDIR